MNTALLVIDVQPVFLKTVHQGDVFLKRCLFAVEAARLLSLPIILTEQTPRKLGGVNGQIKHLAGEDAPCFSKDSFSAFGEASFCDYLKEKDVQHLLITGLDAAICVYQTVMDALREGLGVTVLEDCIGGRRAVDAQTINKSLEKTNCYQLPAETIFYSLIKTSTHPQFRAFNQLVVKYS